MAASSVRLDVMSAGSLVATDDIGGTQHQLIKMEFGPDGAATAVSQTNPLPVAGAFGSIANIGTVKESGTTTGVGTISGVAVVTTVTNLTHGTVENSGTVTGVGTLTNIGTIKEAGTVTGVGTLPGVGVVSNLTNGSIKLTAGTLNAGTVNDGTLTLVTTVSNLTNGSIKMTAGTIGDMTMKIGTVNSGTINAGTINTGTINSGTINAGTINSGTINAGTINAGTIKNDGRPARTILSYGTTIAFGGSAFATLVGSAAIGAGTSLWVNDVSIVNNGGTVTSGLVFGSAINGSAVIAKGNFGPNGGIQKSFSMPVNAGMVNTDLNAWAAGAGTIDFVVSYFISA